MKKYIFKAYKNLYPSLFQKEEKRLREFTGDRVLIEHMGSTAVPGLGGKGIIDIYLRVPEKEMDRYSRLIKKAGYEHKASGGDKNIIFHQRDGIGKSGEIIRYHLHITFTKNQDWKNAILFRDYLRKHPEEAKRYAEVKKKAARESDQTKEKYMSIKEPIIKDLLKKALEEFGVT